VKLQTANLEPVDEIKTRDVIFIGDSISAWVNWQNFFESRIISNYSAGGMTIKYFRQHILDEVIKTRPKKVFIMIGVNDILQGRTVDVIYSDYQAVLAALDDLEAEIIISETLDCSDEKCGFENLEGLNQRLKNYAFEKSLAFINVNEYLDLDKHYTDGVHLNVEGYKIWIEALRPHF